MERKIEIGKVYKHFKGNFYKVIDIVLDCENINNKIVIYEALYGEHLKWARNYSDFISQVDKAKYPDIKQKYRFERVD